MKDKTLWRTDCLVSAIWEWCWLACRVLLFRQTQDMPNLAEEFCLVHYNLSFWGKKSINMLLEKFLFAISGFSWIFTNGKSVSSILRQLWQPQKPYIPSVIPMYVVVPLVTLAILLSYSVIDRVQSTCFENNEPMPLPCYLEALEAKSWLCPPNLPDGIISWWLFQATPSVNVEEGICNRWLALENPGS